MQNNLPEIVFASADKAESQKISRWVRSGLLRKLVPRVYTSNFKDSDRAIVGRNLSSKPWISTSFSPVR